MHCGLRNQFFFLHQFICSLPFFLPFFLTLIQIAAPLVPRIKGPSDTSQFQEYDENASLFRPSPIPVYPKEFEDFQGRHLGVTCCPLALLYASKGFYYYNFCPVCLRSSFVILGDFCRVQCTVYLLLGLKTAFRFDLFGVKIITLPVLALTSNRPSISQNFFVPYVSVISSVYWNVAEPEPPIFCRSHHF